MKTMVTPLDCTFVVKCEGSISLCAASDNAGPYVIRVGKVVCGTFGFDRQGQPWPHIETNSSECQIEMYRAAAEAFEVLVHYIPAMLDVDSIEDIDPAVVREKARVACRAAFNAYVRRSVARG